MIKDEGYENDPRLIQLAAAKAYYSIMCSAEFSGGVTSFKAGDVSVSERAGSVSGAERLLRFAMNDCKGLVRSECFAFLGV